MKNSLQEDMQMVTWEYSGLLVDRAFGERSITGKIRYMSYGACHKKFNANLFVQKYGGKVYGKPNR